MIEARFVEAGEKFERDLGGRLGYTGPGTSVAGGGFALGGGRGALTPTVNLPGATSGTGGLKLSLFDALATKVLTLELNASELDGTTKNIASPRVVTGDKTPATIESGVEVGYVIPAATLGGLATVAFKKAVLGLTVTPQITPDEHVDMKVLVNQDTIGGYTLGIPSINTKKVDTNVLVESGGTVVIGGVYTQDSTEDTSQVPLFGDIPVLGWLFKYNVVTKAKKELLVFITPKIMKDSLGKN
jgi:type IV pilus assembly protein PilQ